MFAALIALLAGPAAAQEPALPDGEITGTVAAGTEGAEVGDVAVRLLVLEGGDVIDDLETTSADGAFAFTVPATARRDYVVTAQYQGVQYILPAVVLSADEPEAEVTLTLYETTETAPELRILDTTVTVVALDRARSELWLRREDTVSVPGDRVFAGGEDGVTLRLPAPEGTIEVNGGTLDGGLVSTSGALFPGDENVIVTAYVVRYDAVQDEYGVRITAPLPTDHMELHVPEDYVRDVVPLEGATRAEDISLPGGGADGEPTVLEAIALDGPIEPGRGLLATLDGLSGERTVHPLTTQPGAGIAAAVALALISGAAVVAWRRRDPAADNT